MTEIFILLVVFQIKHFLCDYPLQTQYMLKKGQHTGWEIPLFLHASTHALGTGVITGFYFLIKDPLYNYTNLVLGLMTIDLIVHFIVDRIKAHPKLGGIFKPNNPKFWYSLGLDQMIHHLTHYTIIFFIITK